MSFLAYFWPILSNLSPDCPNFGPFDLFWPISNLSWPIWAYLRPIWSFLPMQSIIWPFLVFGQYDLCYTARIILLLCIIMPLYARLKHPPWCICCIYTMAYMHCIHLNIDLYVVYTSVSICNICSMKYMLCISDTHVTHHPRCICRIDAMEYMLCIPMCPDVCVMYKLRCVCHTYSIKI